MALTYQRPSADRHPLRGQLTVNSYLTDERRLFRCLPAEQGSMLILEDCQSLELILCEERELLETEMRLVKPGEPDEDGVAQTPLAVGM